MFTNNSADVGAIVVDSSAARQRAIQQGSFKKGSMDLAIGFEPASP